MTVFGGQPPTCFRLGSSDPKSKGRGQDHPTLTRAAAHYSAGVRRPAWVGSAGLRPAPGLRRQAWGTIGSLRLTAASTSRSASLSRATQAHPSSHEGVGVPTGCLAGPASGPRRRGQRGPGVWGALRFVSLTEATEPEHCGRIQIVVSKLQGLSENRTWAFGVWRSNQGTGQAEGGHRPSPIRRTRPDGR